MVDPFVPVEVFVKEMSSKAQPLLGEKLNEAIGVSTTSTVTNAVSEQGISLSVKTSIKS